MTHTNGNGKDSIDSCTLKLCPVAQAVLKGMKEGEKEGYTVVDMTQFAGELYRRSAALQRFGDKVMPQLKENGVIKQVGTKPTMYAVTQQGYAPIKSSQTP